MSLHPLVLLCPAGSCWPSLSCGPPCCLLLAAILSHLADARGLRKDIYFHHSQHTPAWLYLYCWADSVSFPHLCEYASLQRLCKEIHEHVPRRTMFHLYLSFFNFVCNKIILHIKVFCMFTACHATTFCK